MRLRESPLYEHDLEKTTARLRLGAAVHLRDIGQAALVARGAGAALLSFRAPGALLGEQRADGLEVVAVALEAILPTAAASTEREHRHGRNDRAFHANPLCWNEPRIFVPAR